MKRETFLVLCILSLMAALLCGSCEMDGNVQVNTCNDTYTEGQDFNPTAFTWAGTPQNVAVTDQGIYFAVFGFLYYVDTRSESSTEWNARPLCFKLNCQHLREEADKVTDCNAFASTFGVESFVGFYKDHIYFTSINVNTGLYELMMADPDGSNRRTILEDIHNIVGGSMRIHRGRLYYGSSYLDQEGQSKNALMALDLEAGDFQPEALVECRNVAGSFSEILPYGQYIYYNIKDTEEKDDGRIKPLNRYYRYSISNNTGEAIDVPQEYRLLGAYQENLVFYDNKHYYEYDPNMRKAVISSLGTELFQEKHPDWLCLASPFGEDISFVYCEDCTDNPDEEYGTILFKRFIVNAAGETVGSIPEPNSILPHMTSQIVRIRSEEYYLRFSANIEPFTVELYRIQDLLDGKTKPITLLKGDSLSAIGPRSFMIKKIVQ